MKNRYKILKNERVATSAACKLSDNSESGYEFKESVELMPSSFKIEL